MNTRRKRVRHFHEPGDLHELTFSCYQRLPLLTSEAWRQMLAVSIDRAVTGHEFELVAFVFMPEHVHLLVNPLTRAGQPDIEGLLSAIKRPYSFRIKQLLAESNDPLLTKLTIRERPGKQVFRYWQEGPGYDRNVSSERAVLAAIDYIHMNPVRRGLCQRAIDWRWSSARRFILPEGPVEPGLPTIHGVPVGCINSTR